MKFGEILDRLDSPQEPYNGYELLEELGFYCGLSLADHGFTSRVITEWYCTDTVVGMTAIYHNDELICVSLQTARKNPIEFHWVSQQTADEIFLVCRALVPDESRQKVRLISFDGEEGEPSYQLSWGSNVMKRSSHTHAIYQGKTVEVTETYDGHNSATWEKVKISENGNEKIVEISELRFPIKLRKI